ncbi:MAG: TrkA family potassium uptake protein [Myxococcota bacterium]
MAHELETIQDHFVVCGLGTTGRHVVAELTKVGKAVVGMDVDRQRVHAAQGDFEGGIFFLGDASQEEHLTTAAVSRAVGIFCATPNDKDNLMIALSARQLAPKVRLVARSSDPANNGKFRQVGCDAVVNPNHTAGLRMASEMLRPSTATFLDTMLRNKETPARFENVDVPTGAHAAGKTLGQLDIQKNVGLIVVAVVRANGSIEYNPRESFGVTAGDSLIVICNAEQQATLRRYVQSG